MTLPRWGRVPALLVGLALLAALLVRTDALAGWRLLTTVRWPWLAAAVAANFAGLLFEAIRWQLIVRAATGRPARVSSAFAGLLGGALGNAVLPLKLGDGVRAYTLARRDGIDPAAVITTVVIDRVIDGTFLIGLAGAASLAAPLPTPLGRALRVAGAGLLVLWLVLAVLAARGVLQPAETSSRLYHRLVRPLGTFMRALRLMARDHRLASAVAAAIASWIARLLIVWAMCRAFSLPVGVGPAAIVLVVINIGIGVVGTPANVGTFEAAAAGGLMLFGVPAEAAAVVALAQHAVEVIPTLAVAFAVTGWRGLRSAAGPTPDDARSDV